MSNCTRYLLNALGLYLMKMEAKCRIITIAIVLFGLASAEKPTVCPEGYKTVDNMCYAVIPLAMTWPEAWSICDTFGGDLLQVESDMVMTKVLSLFNHAQATTSYWMDGSDVMVPGTWKFHGREGRHMTYTKWAAGNPTGPSGTLCAAVQPGTDAWVSLPCTYKQKAICQIEYVYKMSHTVGKGGLMHQCTTWYQESLLPLVPSIPSHT